MGIRIGNVGEWGMKVFFRMTSTNKRRKRGGTGGTYPTPLLKNSKRLRRYAFLETDVSLANLLAKARALEASEIHATGIEQTFASMEIAEETTNKISIRRKSPSAGQPNKRQATPRSLLNKTPVGIVVGMASQKQPLPRKRKSLFKV